MSSSITFVPVALSAEQRAMIRQQREIERLLPKLLALAQDDIALALDAGLLDQAESATMLDQLGAVDDLGALRSVVTAIPWAGAVAGNGSAPIGEVASPEVSSLEGDDAEAALLGLSSASMIDELATATSTGQFADPLTDASTASAGSPSIGEVGWRLRELGVRIERADVDAGELGLDLHREVASARAVLDRAVGHHAVGAVALADALADRVDRLVSGLDEQVEARLLSLEQEQATLASVVEVLREMGHQVSVGTGADGRPVVHSLAHDGATVTASLDDTETGLELVAEVLDLDDAVPSRDRAAEEVCDPAVEIAVDLHARLRARTDLTLGKVRTDARPTRGHPEASGGSAVDARRRRSSSNVNPGRRRSR